VVYCCWIIDGRLSGVVRCLLRGSQLVAGCLWGWVVVGSSLGGCWVVIAGWLACSVAVGWLLCARCVSV